MKTSEKIRNFIKNYEGLRLNAYLCPAGVWTIGYGHTHGVRKGDKITREIADKYFVMDLIVHENNVSRLVKVPLIQCQFDALVSFEYNVGYGNFASSTMLKLLNAKKYNEAAEQFGEWVFANKKKLPGLVKRRAAEKAFFLNLP